MGNQAPMLKNARNPEAYAKHAMGCSCCNTRQERKAAKKAARQKEQRAWKLDRVPDPGKSQ